MPCGTVNPRAVEPEESWLSRYRRSVETLFDEAQRSNIPLMVIVWQTRVGSGNLSRDPGRRMHAEEHPLSESQLGSEEPRHERYVL